MKLTVLWRLVGYLLLAAVISTSILAGTGTWAKYAAAGEAQANARVAKFSFVAGSQKYLGGGDWAVVNSSVDDEDPDVIVAGKHWREIAITSGASTLFELPLFDYEYSGTDSSLASTATVQGVDDEIVVAPGIGNSHGNPMHNPNTNANVQYFDFRNDSEVTVRFKVEIDPSSSTGGADIFVGSPWIPPWADLGDPAHGWYLVGSHNQPVPISSWNYLDPGQTYANLGILWTWPFDDAGPLGAWWTDTVTYGYMTSYDDEKHTQLGKQAAAALAGVGTAPKIDLKFRITVEQVD